MSLSKQEQRWRGISRQSYFNNQTKQADPTTQDSARYEITAWLWRQASQTQPRRRFSANLFSDP